MRQRLAHILAIALLLGMHAFAQAYQPKDEAVSHMEPREARRQAAELLTHFALEGRMVKGIAFTTERMELQIEGESQAKIYSFKDIPPLEVTGSRWTYCRIAIGKGNVLHTVNCARVEKLADALHRLKMESAKASDPAAEAAFAEVASRYRAASPQPEFPEEARRLRVQAEAMLREKRFADAADLYGEALRAVPWWPEGRFNRALVLGELKEYDEAGREMKRYLLLVPDAPNARAVQEQI